MLWVVGNERAELKDSAAEVSVWASHDVWRGHSWPKGTEDLGKGGVIQLLNEHSILVRGLLMSD